LAHLPDLGSFDVVNVPLVDGTAAFLREIGLRGVLEVGLQKRCELVDVVEDSTLEGSHIILETSIGRVDGNIGQRLSDLDVIIHRAHASAAEPPHGTAADPLQAPHG
jgi:hypothetical protein